MNNPPDHHRRSIRLPEYDYASPGAYFITLVTHRRTCLFGDVRNNEMVCNPVSIMIQEVWSSLPERFPGHAKSFSWNNHH
jgi:putative transposase